MPDYTAIGAGAGGAGLIGGIAGLFQGGGTGVNVRRGNRNTIIGTEQGLQRVLPQYLGFEQYYQPQLLGLGGQNLQDILFGTQGGQYTVPYTDWRGRHLNYTGTQQATPGLLSTIGQAAPVLQGLANASASSARGQNLADFTQFLPGYKAAYEEATPELAALRTSLANRAQQGLAAGGNLLPEDYSRIIRDNRLNYASRGLAGTDPEALARAVQLQTGGEAARSSRQNFALNTADALYRSQPDYWNAIMNERGSFPQALGLATGEQNLAYRQYFNPMGGLGAQAAGVGAYTANQQQQQNYLAGLSGGLLGLGGSLLGI